MSIDKAVGMNTTPLVDESTWGRDEAALEIARFRGLIEDGEDAAVALDSLRRAMAHAATFIDVPDQLQAYCDAVRDVVPEVGD